MVLILLYLFPPKGSVATRLGQAVLCVQSLIHVKYTRGLDQNMWNNIDFLAVCDVQVDWDGYTIGYYGRIFEARNKAKGGSFEVPLISS